MVLVQYIQYIVIVVAIVVSGCYSKDVRISQRLKRDADCNTQEIIDMLRAQDEKINRLHVTILANQFLPKCAAAVKTGNLIAGSECWKNMISQVKTIDQFISTESKLLSQLVIDSYDGDRTRLVQIVTFIKNNVEKGSEIAHNVYRTLLDAMIKFNHFYWKKVNDSMEGVVDNIYRTLNAIRNAEGEGSIVVNNILPTVVNDILSGRELFIRNSVTLDFMYARYDNSSDTKILVDGQNGNGSDSRFIWKLKPVQRYWKHDAELFCIENKFENKILTVANEIDNGLLLVDEKENWSMFYIRLVQGIKGDEVAIQWNYGRERTLDSDVRDTRKIPKMLYPKTFETSVWHLQPKV